MAVVCKFAQKKKKKKLFLVVKFHLIAVFQSFGLLQPSLSKFVALSNCKEIHVK